jgi:threonine/homoserine/homoserine lactone efflux protein
MYLTIAAIVVVVHTVYSTSVQRIRKGLDANRWIVAAKRTSGVLFVLLGFRLLTTRQT